MRGNVIIQGFYFLSLQWDGEQEEMPSDHRRQAGKEGEDVK